MPENDSLSHAPSSRAGKFRKKPIVIDAIRAYDVLDGARAEWKRLPEWIREAYETGLLLFGNKTVSIRTLEGTHEAMLHDWIIRGVRGELYPCKPEIFDATYERVETSAAQDARPAGGPKDAA